MRNRILGAIGIMWGVAILVRSYLVGGPFGNGAFLAGQVTALVFAALFVLVGAYYLVKGSRRP
jgi:hypothetical protein